MAVLPFFEAEQLIAQDCLKRSLQNIVPGVNGVVGSFWRWLHPEFPYMTLYIEMQRLRGKMISPKETRSLEHALEEQLLNILQAPSSCLFWPFNEEEAYKQIQVLQRELSAPSDLPQVTIHFRHRSTQSLEFMINLVRPASDRSVTLQATTLPPSVRFFPHFMREIKLPFPREACCFSLFLPTHYFNEHHTVNLLQARNCVVQHLFNT